MANLLPETQQKLMKATFHGRFMLTAALLLLSTAAIAALSLLPSYLVLVVAEPAELSAAQKASESKQDQQQLMSTQALVKEVLPVLNATSSPTQMIKDVISLRTKGITISNFSYLSAAPSVLTVNGIGGGRESVNGYREALLKSGKFVSVSIPVSAIVGAVEGGSFTATISGQY